MHKGFVKGTGAKHRPLVRSRHRGGRTTLNRPLEGGAQMRIRRMGVALAAVTLLGLGAVAAPATATHDVPAVADSFNVEMVPNFRQTITATQCTARGGLNSSHGPPLAFASCNPPGFVPGTQAHAGPQATSAADVTVIPGDTDPTNGDQADIALTGFGTDVRTGSATGPDYNPAASGADMNSVGKIRISDHYNGTTGQPCAASGSCPATVSDLDFAAPVTCVPTVDPSVGSSCTIGTTADSLIPGIVLEQKKAVIQAFRLRLKDAGANGAPGDTDDRDAFMQGIYIP